MKTYWFREYVLRSNGSYRFYNDVLLLRAERVRSDDPDTRYFPAECLYLQLVVDTFFDFVGGFVRRKDLPENRDEKPVYAFRGNLKRSEMRYKLNCFYARLLTPYVEHSLIIINC